MSDGLSQGVGNAAGGNSGEKGHWNNDGPTAGNRSKKSGSNDVISRKTSGKAMNVKDAGRRQTSKDGTREGNGNKVTRNTNAMRIRAEPDGGIRGEVPNGIGKERAGKTSNTVGSNGANAVETKNRALSKENAHKRKRKDGGGNSGGSIVTQSSKKKKRKKEKGSEKRENLINMKKITAKISQDKHRKK